MPITHAFPKEELASRLVAVRQEMKKNNLDAILVAVPENIYYLTGLDHWGYFACHVLFVPLEGDMILICRQMEQVSVERYVLNANFYGFKDYENPADFIFKAIKDSKCDTSNIGIEKNSRLTRIKNYELIIRDFGLLNYVKDHNMRLKYLENFTYSKSQLRQDLFVLNELNYKRNGFFVEFGATNGVDLSNTYLLEKNFDWKGLLSEPAKVWHEALINNRKCSIEKNCIWSKSQERLNFKEVSEAEFSNPGKPVEPALQCERFDCCTLPVLHHSLGFTLLTFSDDGRGSSDLCPGAGQHSFSGNLCVFYSGDDGTDHWGNGDQPNRD